MKQILLPILFFFSIQFAIGQTWQPLYSEETLNYISTSSPETSIGIFAGNWNPLTLKLSLYGDDECGADDCEDCYQLYSTFLQSEMLISTDGVITFQDPETFFIHSMADVGDSWVFGTDENENEITATVTELSEIEILSQTDSLKTIALSDGREIQLSKAHGIYQWITSEDTLILTSIPQRGLGEIYLTKNDVYDFNIGDVFCYRTESLDYMSPQFTGVESSTTSTKISRYEVINRTDSENFREIEFALTSYYDTYSYTIPGDIIVEDGLVQDTVAFTFDLSLPDRIFSIPDQGYFYRASIPVESEAFWITGNPEIYSMVEFQFTGRSIKLEHNEINGHKVSGFGIKNFFFAFDADTPVEDILNASPFDQFDFSYGLNCSENMITSFNPGNKMFEIDESGFEEVYDPYIINDISAYAEGLGNLAFLGRYSSIGDYGYSNSILIGYQKGEETFGYVPSEEDLIILNVSDISSSVSFSVYPNPASNSIQITTSEAAPSELRVYDISGREIFSDKMIGYKSEIQTGNYPAGIYFIQLDTPNGVAVQKVIVAH